MSPVNRKGTEPFMKRQQEAIQKPYRINMNGRFIYGENIQCFSQKTTHFICNLHGTKYPKDGFAATKKQSVS